MTLRHLAIFIRVCDERNMTKAAQKMHMTQPSVSQAVQEMESHYRVRLFERLGRKLFITAAGEKLLTVARHIVNLSVQAEEAMRQFGAVYQIRLGASVTIGECVLIELIQRLYQLYPARQITSAIHNTAVLEKMILEDALDLALIEGAIQSEYLVAAPFMEDELIFIAAPSHALLKKKVIIPEDLASVDFIVREDGSGTRDLFEKVMAEHRIQCRIAGIYNNAETIKKAVIAGLGVSVISRLAVRHELEQGRLCKVTIDDLVFRRSFSIVHHKNKYMSEEIKNIIKVCQSMNVPV